MMENMSDEPSNINAQPFDNHAFRVGTAAAGGGVANDAASAFYTARQVNDSLHDVNSVLTQPELAPWSRVAGGNALDMEGNPTGLRLPASPNPEGAAPRGGNDRLSGSPGVLGGGLSMWNGYNALRNEQSTDDIVNGVSQMTGGALTMGGGVSTLAGAAPAAQVFGVATGALEAGTGVYNVARSGFDLDHLGGGSDTVRRDGSYTDHAQQLSDGIGGIIHGGLSGGAALAGATPAGAVMSVGALGYGAGTAAVNYADQVARRDRLYGNDEFARAGGRGVRPSNEPVQAASGSEDAATQGAHAYQNTFHNTWNDGLLGTGLGAHNETLADVAANVSGATSTVGHAIYNTGNGIVHGIGDAASGAYHQVANLLHGW
jgi:hypothetical protein